MTGTCRLFQIPMFFLTLVIAAVIILLIAQADLTAFTVDSSESHGEQKHGGAAVEIRCKVENNNVLFSWINPQTGRCADVVKLDDGKFGMQISRIAENVADSKRFEITAFVKEKMTNVEQVMRYLLNRGYGPE